MIFIVVGVGFFVFVKEGKNYLVGYMVWLDDVFMNLKVVWCFVIILVV